MYLYFVYSISIYNTYLDYYFKQNLGENQVLPFNFIPMRWRATENFELFSYPYAYNIVISQVKLLNLCGKYLHYYFIQPWIKEDRYIFSLRDRYKKNISFNSQRDTWYESKRKLWDIYLQLIHNQVKKNTFALVYSQQWQLENR